MTEVKHVVVGVDGSEGSIRALAWAHEEARHHQARLTALAAWQPLAMPLVPPYGSPTAGAVVEPRQLAVAAVEAAVKDLDADVDVETSVVEGNPAKVLIEHSADADLLVVGSRGHGGFVGLLLGSVGVHCATHAACPVVIVR